MHSLQITIDFIAVGLLLFFACHALIRPRRFPLPPGPRGWPMIGNLLDVPKGNLHVAYKEMGRKYGAYHGCINSWLLSLTKLIGSDLIYLNMAGTSTLILNSAEAANDLFVGRSKLYSDRFAVTALGAADLKNLILTFDCRPHFTMLDL